MKQEYSNIAYIITKYIKGLCDESEKKSLNQWLSEDDKNKDLLAYFEKSDNLQAELRKYNLYDADRAWVRFDTHVSSSEAGSRKINTRWYLYAACVAFLIISVSIFYSRLNSSSDVVEIIAEGKLLKNSAGQILPATTGAVIITSTGKQMNMEDSFKINEDGAIESENIITQDINTVSEPKYYDLIVPKAKVIQFTMFEGSKVWVNANSRLRIPTGMQNNERKIILLSGEAYFEVEKHNGSKFIVENEKGKIEVLGTKFNVNNFDGNFKTTLVEGSVRMSNDFNEKVLVPNTSAILYKGEFIVSKASVDADLAWKNNTFYFNNFSIQKISSQIENWYGVKVHINDAVAKSKSTYSGELRRDVPLNELRKMLEFISGLEVQIVGDELNINN